MQAKLTQWIHKQWQKKGILARLLYPLSLITAKTVKKRQQKKVTRPTQWPPIIIVGNILVGGTGKTPIVIYLCKQLKQMGWHPGVISRGYGVKIKNKAIAGTAPLDARYVGDEPSLIAQAAKVPIAVHPNRNCAVEALLKLAPAVDVIISDDGLQHYALGRDIEIIVQDDRGIGNGWLIPAGPLREPAKRKNKVDWVITHHTSPAVKKTNTDIANSQKQEKKVKQVEMRLKPTHITQLAKNKNFTTQHWLKQHTNTPCQAIAAIGQPQRFFSMLKQMGIQLTSTKALPDHEVIKESDIKLFATYPILITKIGRAHV